MQDKAISDFLLALYRANRDVAFHRFQTTVLEQLTNVIAFDSAWWGNASGDTMQIHRIHIHNCAPTIIEDYPRYMEEDFFRQAMIDHPGKTANLDALVPRTEFVKTRLYREYARKYKVQAAIGTLLIDPISSLFEFLTIWRHEHRPFTTEECRVKEFLMPHLVESHRSSRFYHVVGQDARLRSRDWAIADSLGYLHETTAGFTALLRSEWPDWRTSQLPVPLRDAVNAAHAFGGKRIAVRVDRYEDLRFIEPRMLASIDRLGERELAVARRYADGQTYKEIATALRSSPTTIRNQIARSFKKLGVKNKAELTRRLMELAAGG